MFISIIIVLCLLTTLVVVESNIIPQRDNPIVRYSATEIPTVKTDFLYTDLLKQRHNFHADANKELMTMKPALVQPNKELKIIFNQKPFNFMIAKQLDNGNFEFISIEEKNEVSSIITPNKPGKYVYGISAIYSEGTALYYFSIEVEK